MTTDRRTALTTGTLFVLAAVASIVGLLQYGPILDHSDYVVQGSSQSTRVAVGALLELVCAFSIIGIPVAMFPILRRRSESVALGYACFRLLEATVIVVGIISLLSVVTLHQHHAGATAGAADPGASSYLVASRLLVAVHDWTFLFGPNLALAPSTLMMGLFLLRTRLVPRPIAVLGIVGGTLIFVSGVCVLFGAYQQISAWGTVTALPVFCYEMSLAGWLIVKGFDSGALDALSGPVALR
jgi:hypothetical protein